MQTKHKIQAFTLSEMIVVIIITTIVIGMAFSVLSMVQKHMNGIQANFNRSLELNKLEQLLNIDLNRFSEVSYEIKENRLVFSSEIGATSYQFVDNKIIKNRDTFNIEVQQKLFYFDGETILEGQIDAIKIETSKAFQSQKLFVYKRNDATLFLN